MLFMHLKWLNSDFIHELCFRSSVWTTAAAFVSDWDENQNNQMLLIYNLRLFPGWGEEEKNTLEGHVRKWYQNKENENSNKFYSDRSIIYIQNINKHHLINLLEAERTSSITWYFSLICGGFLPSAGRFNTNTYIIYLNLYCSFISSLVSLKNLKEQTDQANFRNFEGGTKCALSGLMSVCY